MPTFHRATGAENIESFLAASIGAGDAAPFTKAVTPATGALFGSVPMPILVTIALDTESESGGASRVETFEVSAVSDDDLTFNVRALAGTSAQNWPSGSKVSMRLSSLHLDEIHDALDASSEITGEAMTYVSGTTWRIAHDPLGFVQIFDGADFLIPALDYTQSGPPGRDFTFSVNPVNPFAVYPH